MQLSNNDETKRKPASVWRETAPSLPPFEKLKRSLSTEVVIVGAGFTGLSAAHHLAERGIECIVIDEHEPGWGASGRNGGMLVPRTKIAPSRIEQTWGRSEALEQRRLLHSALDTVSHLIDYYSIDCAFRKGGYVAAAHNARYLAKLAEDVNWLHEIAGEVDVRSLSGEQIAEMIGSTAYVGGYFDPLGATVQPLAYVEGLADGLRRRGVGIYGDCYVERMDEDLSGVRLVAGGFNISSMHVILATNAYTPAFGFPGALARRIVAVSSSVIATEPLLQGIPSEIFPNGVAVSDTKHLLNWARLTPDNRLVFGGRGDITGRSDSIHSYRELEQVMKTTFPFVAHTKITHRWSGKVAVTRDGWHHLGSFHPKMHYAVGYGGRGVAMSALMGRLLAELVEGKRIDLGPITASKNFTVFPFHNFRIPAMRIAAAYYRMRDFFGM